jgi:hypothetical protein
VLGGEPSEGRCATDLLDRLDHGPARHEILALPAQPKSKFKVRYATFGFQPEAWLHEEDMWPIVFALTSLTVANEKPIAELVERAAS